VKKYQSIRLILGDQLNFQHSWFQDSKEEFLYVFMEIKPESEYVTHHIQKIAGIFLCMREFKKKLKGNGFKTKYFQINDSDNFQSFEKNLSF